MPVKGICILVKVAAVSGYKPFELGIFQQNHPSVQYIKLAIKKELVALLEEGLEWVIITGQLGTELWAAEVVFDLQDEFPELKLAVLAPFFEQEARWNESNKEWYESVVARADFFDIITKRKYESPWQFRVKNQFLIEKTDALILLYDPEKEGSPKFLYEAALEYQKDHPYDVHFITFYDLQLAVEEEQLKREVY
jgi:uncharacterized phage-like protein YoqJ